MKRRSKLSLSPSRESVKKRPEGFATATAVSSPSPHSAQEIRPAQQVRPARGARPAQDVLASGEPPPKQPPSPVNPARPRVRGTSNREAQHQSSWLDTGTIVKALLVVGAAALSIFLLKRRVF
jgi:hypothetical protein